MPIDVGEFEEANQRRHLQCWFALLPFTDEQRNKVAEVCDRRKDISHIAISRVLEGWQYKVDDGSVARHRQRRCHCPKP